MNPSETLHLAMIPPSLDYAQEAGVVEVEGLILTVTPDTSWTVPGENQIATTTQGRLVEWAREAMQEAMNQITPFDTRIVHIEGDFSHEVKNNSPIHIRPERLTFGTTSMTTVFAVIQEEVVCSRFIVVQVTVETIDSKTVKKPIPSEIKEAKEFAHLIASN